MELSQLIYFRTTAREEHFTRAAEKLHITQPSLSKAIANLEEELGTPLFDREGKRVRLNAYGHALLEKAEQILTLTDEAKFMIRDMLLGEQGHVRIGSSFPITAPSPLYYYQYAFFSAHPQVALSLYTHSSERIESLLEERKLDFGVSLVPSTHPDIKSTPLYTDKLGIIVGPDHRFAGRTEIFLRELASEAFLCNASGPDPNDSARYLCGQAGFVPRIIYEGESSELIGESVYAGRGISFVSQMRHQLYSRRANAPDWEKELRFIILADSFSTRTVYLYMRSGGYLSRAVELFHQEMMDYLSSRDN